MWKSLSETVENNVLTPRNPCTEHENPTCQPKRDKPPDRHQHDGMTHADALQLLARWITELRAENAGLRRENEWHKHTLGRRWDRIRHLERKVELLDNRMYRFWMATYTPEQTKELAAELVA